MFEHGANHEGSLVGCGVNHAHLHLVPSPISLVPHFPKTAAKLEWQFARSSTLLEGVNGREYLFYCENALEPDPLGQIAFVKATVSQYFRRAFAASIGKDAEFDYRSFPSLDNTRTTIQYFDDRVAIVARAAA
jgi:ATP adenylyltransferase